MDLRCVWWILALFPLSCISLTLMVSRDDLLYGLTGSVTLELFGLIEYQDFASLLNVASLLEKDHTLQRYFDSQYIYSERAKILVDSVIGYPQLHPILLSFRLCDANFDLAKALRPYLSLYRPKAIRRFNYGDLAFSYEDLTVLLKGIKPGWTDIYNSAWIIVEKGPSLDMRFDIDSRYFPEAEGIFHAIDEMIPLSNEQILLRTNSPNIPEFDEALRLFTQDPCTKYEELSKMDDILVEFMKSKGFCSVRVAFWRLKLTYNSLKLFDTVRSLVDLSANVALPAFSLFQKIVLSSNVSDLCPALLDDLLELLSRRKCYFKLGADFIPKLQEIYALYPEFPFIGGEDRSQSIRRWVDYTQESRSESCPSIPGGSLSLDKAILWWGAYTKSTEGIFMPSKLPTNFSIQFNRKQQPLHTLPELLETFTSFVSSEKAGIFKMNPDGLIFRDKIDDPYRHKFRLLFRTILCNLVYRGKIGFEFAQLTHDSLFNYDQEPSNPFVKHAWERLHATRFPFPLVPEK